MIPYKLYIGAALVLVILGTLGAQAFKIQSLSADLSTTQTSLEAHKAGLHAANTEILLVNGKITKLETDRAAFESKLLHIANKASARVTKLESLRGKEDVVKASPVAAEAEANKIFVQQESRLACLTGNKKLCES